MPRTEEFEFNGYKATVIIPENPNGKWIWKTEFLYAFDQAERTLLEQGYTRVYYQISDKYGSAKAVRLMRKFHKFLIEKYELCKKTILFGFSRGGLYAFNYALYYPEWVEKIYLDAPVLNLKSWPKQNSKEQAQFFEEYHINSDTYKTFHDSPIDNLEEFFACKIPVLLVAGDSDLLVPFAENGKIMLEKSLACKADLKCILKKDCGHHPHSLEDVRPIIEFINAKM